MKKELDVVAALIRKGYRILLCQRRDEDKYGLFWEFPGGAVEENEQFGAALEREIKEELNLDIKADKLIKEFYDEDHSLIIKVFLFSCSIKEGLPSAVECKNFGFFAPSQIERLKLAPVDKKILSYLKTL